MRRIGMKMPVRTLQAARKTGLSLPLACSVLAQETGGGINEFGHDPTIFVGAGQVTESKYHAYKAERVRSANHLMQGVGPVQLTWWSTQDAADAIGGCWRPLKNMLIGFEHLVESIRRDGLRAGVAAYNGSGPAAQRYADQVLARAAGYAKVLRKPWPPR
jgi:hypothetical protein